MLSSTKYKVSTLIALCIGYALWFGSRDLINGASSRLLELSILRKMDYRNMIMAATIAQAVSKVVAAVIVDYTNSPYLIFVIAGVITGTITISPLFTHNYSHLAWVMHYVSVKSFSCFARVSMINILLRYFARDTFGRITLGIQLIAAAGDAFSHLLTGQLMKLHWHYMFLVQGLVTISGVMLVAIPRICFPSYEADTIKSTQSYHTKAQAHQVWDDYKKLLRTPSLYILLILVSLSTLIRSQTYYYVILFAFVLNLTNKEAVSINAATPLAMCLGVTIFGFIVEKKLYNSSKMRYYSPILFCLVGCICTIIFAALIHTKMIQTNMILKVCGIIVMNLIQMSFQGTFVCLDGKYAIDLAPKNAVGFSCNLISSIGYVSALLIQYFLSQKAYTIEGWRAITIMNVIGSFSFTLLLCLYYRLNPMKN